MSEQWLAADELFEWFHKIEAFFVHPKFIPKGQEKAMIALGPNQNQLPQDLEVTFFFSYVKGNFCVQIFSFAKGFHFFSNN